MPIREDIVSEARKYLGVRFQHQGRTQHGIDCVGLVVVVGKTLGLLNADRVGYSRRPFNDELPKFMLEEFVSVDEALPGDILTFDFGPGVSHAGIVTPSGLIHAYASKRKVVEHRLDDDWRRKVWRAFRYPGVC